MSICLRNSRFLLAAFGLLMLAGSMAGAQIIATRSGAQDNETVAIWPASRAGADAPSLTIVRPHKRLANGAAVVIAPGGAYVALARALEGMEPAHWLAARGITAFVLTYRVGPTAPLPTPLLDGARAMRFVRAHAGGYGVDPARIGMMGFSAGGHLAATTAVEATAGDPGAADPVERVASRPDFLILGYPWLEGTRRKADGSSSYCDFAKRAGSRACDPAKFEQYQPTGKVGARTPPTFIYHTSDDALVPAQGSVRFYLALKEAGVPVELHLFEHGRHGSGLGGSDPSLSMWPTLLQEWLRRRGLLPDPGPDGLHP